MFIELNRIILRESSAKSFYFIDYLRISIYAFTKCFFDVKNNHRAKLFRPNIPSPQELTNVSQVS